MTERISSYSRVAFHGDDLTLNLMNSRIEGDENKNEIQNNVQDNMSLDNAPKDKEFGDFVVFNSRQHLNQSSKNLANAFVDMLKGNKVPSEIIIKNEQGQDDPALQKQLASAAVKIATAMMTTVGTNKTIYLGFQIGDFTLELSRDAEGKFSVEVEGISEEGVTESFDVNIDDVDNEFAKRITYDILKNDDNDLYDKGASDKRFGALDQILVASDEGGKSPLSREAFATILNARKKIPFADMENVGTGVLRHLAAQTVLDPKLTEKAIKAELERIRSVPPIMVNSAEASRDMQNITELLNKDPIQVTSKVNIENIGQVRTDPQAGMSEPQKKIHNLIADLFMPADTSLYDNNDGQAGKRILQILLKRIDAVKILSEEKLRTGKLPLDTLPDHVKNLLWPKLDDLISKITENYTASLGHEGEVQDNHNLKKTDLDINKLKKSIRNIPVEQFLVIEKSVIEATEQMAKEQQQVLTEKFNTSLQKSEDIKAQNDANKPFYEIDLKNIYDKHVKTVVDEKLKNSNPEEYKKQTEQFKKENIEALREILVIYKKPLLSLLTIVHITNNHDAGELKNKAVEEYIDDQSKLFKFIQQLTGTMQVLIGYNPNIPAELSNWNTESGSEIFDKLIASMDQKEVFMSLENTDNWLPLAMEIQPGENKTALQKEITVFTSLDVLKALNIDLKSKTLAEMANEPDDFSKPGMGQLIKKVLNSYFSTDEIKDTAMVNARQTDKRSMIGAMIRYSDNNASQAAQLGAMLKGAGPLMHKLLQGLNLPGMDPDLKAALEDMKSNLSPIDPVYVQAQMHKVVNESNGKILNLSIEKPLGAASVGQAFLVKVTPSEGEPYTAVLKIIRPEVKVKTQREYAEFMREAEKIPGMKETYAGIYAQYQREFDLKLEAANIKLGQEAYNDNIDMDRVGTMSLVDNAPVSETSMLIKQAEGTTLDSYICNVKAKIEELKSKPFKTHSEVLNIKNELLRLYKELKDVNTSLNLTAKKWFNKALFNKEGFFHGDMHAGNLIVKPRDPDVTDPTDPKGKTLITIIDYGNASKLDSKQTSGVLKVNIATSFGGLYQFNADEEQKPYVEKHTLRVFLEGFKNLLSTEEKEKFKAREKDITERIIKPILFKGSKYEVGIRLNLLIKKLQEEGIAIPGAIANMCQSENRLGNALDDINALMDSISETLDNTGIKFIDPSDPAGKMIFDSDVVPIKKKDIEFLENKLNYDLSNTAPLDKWENLDQFKIDQGADPNEIKAISSAKAEASAKVKEYIRAEETQMSVLLGVFSCFKNTENDVWINRTIHEDISDADSLKRIKSMALGTYLKSDKNSDEVYPLHKEFLALRDKVSKENLDDIEKTLSEFKSAKLDKSHARAHLKDLLKKPEIKALYDCAEKIKSIMTIRMIENLKNYEKIYAMKNPIKADPGLSEKKDLTTATIEVVNDQLTGKDRFETLANAKKFADNSLGIGFTDLLFNSDNKKDFVNFIADNFSPEQKE